MYYIFQQMFEKRISLKRINNIVNKVKLQSAASFHHQLMVSSVLFSLISKSNASTNRKLEPDWFNEAAKITAAKFHSISQIGRMRQFPPTSASR